MIRAQIVSLLFVLLGMPEALADSPVQCKVIQITYWANQATPSHQITSYARAYPSPQDTLTVTIEPGTDEPVRAKFVRRKLGVRILEVNLEYPDRNAPVLRGADRVIVRCLEASSDS